MGLPERERGGFKMGVIGGFKMAVQRLSWCLPSRVYIYYLYTGMYDTRRYIWPYGLVSWKVLFETFQYNPDVTL